MKLQNRLAHAAVVTKWKVDQQMRLTKGQDEVRATERKIKDEKIRLADAALVLYDQGSLSADSLKEICAGIQDLHELLGKQQNRVEAIRSEQPPALAEMPEAETTADAASLDSEPSGSELICPRCKKAVPVRFCPDCGAEGVTPPAV